MAKFKEDNSNIWIKLPPEKAYFHKLGKGNYNNNKYITANGFHEAVYKDGKLIR